MQVLFDYLAPSQRVKEYEIFPSSEAISPPTPEEEPIEEDSVEEAKEEPRPILRSPEKKKKTKKRVIVNEEKNEIHEIPSVFEVRMEGGVEELPMGTRRPFVDEFGAVSYDYELQHNDGHRCGANLIYYFNRTVKWSYGPVELLLHFRFPLMVRIPSLGVEFRIFLDKVDIVRPDEEITRYEPLDGIVIDKRRRQDGGGVYELTNEIRTGRTEVFHGESDRPAYEDRVLMREMDGFEEFMKYEEGAVSWTGFVHTSKEIKKYQVTAFQNGRVRISFALSEEDEEKLVMVAQPSADSVVIVHSKGKTNTVCCDLGAPARKRQRSGKFTATAAKLIEPTKEE